jgi:hypothetical protein
MGSERCLEPATGLKNMSPKIARFVTALHRFEA